MSPLQVIVLIASIWLISTLGTAATEDDIPPKNLDEDNVLDKDID